ncbi:uncharacterized protein LOC132735487 isoform X1 [Ruditapes philippinarum]|uniref:uncharacterized protein LOC132735487 isoform X1 n=1 Tax=Ruditapes philippinarum TaxID=129788 RepID=UPI00295B6412|nr:uncharacterized protein LOC132735487 isoform X1 [Ruditapes philippinarum]
MSVDREYLSLSLTKVLNDIGVNEGGMLKRRRSQLLIESVETIANRTIGNNVTVFNFGSQSEGTTTIGLTSDTDALFCRHDYNIIQDWSEWEYGKDNYLMIQDENTTPGYCFLQLLRSHEPLPMPVLPFEDNKIVDSLGGRMLLKNRMIDSSMVHGSVKHGPSIAFQGMSEMQDKDNVIAYPCKSWPQSASGWLERQGLGTWPTHEMRRSAARTGCFVVPTGSKVSLYPELEWRISTSLAERCLMFDLNITQIRCFVLMKMILKSFLNPRGEINVSSFMCKTVLLHCIESTESSTWKDNNLFTCLTYCLLELHSCVQNDHLSHFIIHENNLMVGQLTNETKLLLSKNISDFIESDGQMLLRIDIDDLGLRLKVEMNLVPQRAYNFQSSLKICNTLSATKLINLASELSVYYKHVLHYVHVFNDTGISTLKQYTENLIAYSVKGHRLEQAAFKLFAPFLYTTYGTALASSSIGENNQVSPEALVWLSAGLNSDNSSSRLKLASVFYSVGDMKKTEDILRQTEHHYFSHPVLPICACWEHAVRVVIDGFGRVCTEQNEDCIKHITAFCVQFIPQEIHCVPQELQYEMYRSTPDGMFHRGPFDYWMDWAVVDTLPFLYFLQYKTYSRLRREREKQQALDKLSKTIEMDKRIKSLWHEETALNLLGQCQEQEERRQEALECYIRSLHVRARNNVAVIHICKLFSCLLNQKLFEVVR